MQENPANFEIKRYLGLIQRRKYIVLSVVLGVLSLFTWGSFLIPKTYESSCTVAIENAGIVKPIIQGPGVSVSTVERQRNIRNRITSRSLIERVIKKLNLDAGFKYPSQDDELAATIQKGIFVTMQSFGESESDLFTVAYRGDNPSAVQKMADTLVQEFINNSIAYQRSDAVGAYEFIEDQITEYKAKLEASDKAIRKFRELHPQMIPQNENVIVGRLGTFQDAIVDGEIRKKELLRKRESLQKQLSGEKELTVAFVSNEESPESRLNFLNSQLMILMTKYTESYPEVLKVKSEIDELQKQIAQTSTGVKGNDTRGEMKAMNPVYRQIKEELQKTDTELDSLKARLEELAVQQNANRQVLGRMPKEQEEWSKLQRDRNVTQKVYDDLLEKLESARVSKNLELADKSTRYRVVDPPLLPRVPVKPNRVLLILAGLMAGIASGVCTAVGLDYLNSSFKDEDSLQKALNLPVLAAIPAIVTDADVLKEKMMDKKVFTAAAAYLSLIGVVLIADILYRIGIIGNH
jgi:polysaccharide chain length determinant protein (PEP-CTERM system associated)